MSIKTSSIINKPFDYLFVFFPFWFPIIYLYLISSFPSISSALFIIVLFLFAETHFGSTWLFFFDKSNWQWLYSNQYKLIFLPIYILLIVTFVWFVNPAAVLLFHYLASGWHVTRQSVGISKISRRGGNPFSLLIYLPSLLFLCLGLVRPGIFSGLVLLPKFSSYLIFLLIGYFFFIYFLSFPLRDSKITTLLPIVTGISIYLPILFFKDLAIASAIGVGMHWVQYIALMWTLDSRKNRTIFSSPGSLLRNRRFSTRIIFVIAYSFLMTVFAFFGMPRMISGSMHYSFLYLIPLLFQLYHFYIDRFIWKFSDSHIRQSVQPYLYSSDS